MKDKLVREYGATALWLISTGAVCAILNRGFNTLWRDTNTILDPVVGALQGLALVGVSWLMGKGLLNPGNKSNTFTPADVESALGPPEARISLGKKLSYKYRHLTIEFQNGRVAHVR